MSANSVVSAPPVTLSKEEEKDARSRSASCSLADYEDISGESVAALPRTTSTPTEPVATVSATQEKEKEDEQDEQDQQEQEQDEEQEKENEEQEQEKENEEQEQDEKEKQKQQQEDLLDLSANLAGPILLFGGIVLVGLTFFMNQPVTIEHPFTHRDYF
jgi:hypothetical protein